MRVLVWRRARLQDCLWRIKWLLLVVLLLLVVAPVRNLVFYFVLPGLWTEHSSLLLLKVMWDFQYFRMEGTAIGQSPVRVNVNMNILQEEQTSLKQAFPAYHERITLLRRTSLTDIQAKTELEELLKFQPMSQHERTIALFTLDVFMAACEAANLTYFLISGSALGAVRHHGMIPWDDDIDIIMNSSQWRTIRDVLSNVPGFELFAPKNVQWKFFLKSLPAGNRPFKWPNVDIFFFGEDNSHIWAQTWGAKGSLCNHKSDVFPLRRRKFENRLLPVPRRIDRLVAAEFGDFDAVCRTASYNHKTNKQIADSSMTDCRKLLDVFPFVFRQQTQPGFVLELCKVAGRIVGNITVQVEA